jgi:dipeptidyl-peptidase-4
LIDGYTFDATEKTMLLACNSKQIFAIRLHRLLFVSNRTKELTKLFDFQIQEPTFSPDGRKLLTQEIIIYMISKQTTQITHRR